VAASEGIRTLRKRLPNPLATGLRLGRLTGFVDRSERKEKDAALPFDIAAPGGQGVTIRREREVDDRGQVGWHRQRCEASSSRHVPEIDARGPVEPNGQPSPSGEKASDNTA